MRKNHKLKPILLPRYSDRPGPYECPTDRWPWVKLIDEIAVISGSFLSYPRFELWDGDEVELYAHIDVIFPRNYESIVIVVPKTEYGQFVLRRALGELSLFA